MFEFDRYASVYFARMTGLWWSGTEFFWIPNVKQLVRLCQKM